MSDNENPEAATADDTAAGFGAPKTLPAKKMLGDDEFTKAVAERPVTPVAPPAPPPKGKYCIDYEYNNQQIHETHATLRGAVARVADLKRLGIVPATSVAG